MKKNLTRALSLVMVLTIIGLAPIASYAGLQNGLPSAIPAGKTQLGWIAGGAGNTAENFNHAGLTEDTVRQFSYQFENADGTLKGRVQGDDGEIRIFALRNDINPRNGHPVGTFAEIRKADDTYFRGAAGEVAASAYEIAVYEFAYQFTQYFATMTATAHDHGNHTAHKLPTDRESAERFPINTDYTAAADPEKCIVFTYSRDDLGGMMSAMVFEGTVKYVSGLRSCMSLDNFRKIRTYTDGTFTDIDSRWYTEWVQRAYEYGIMEGIGNNRFNPTGSLTGAEALTIAARIHSVYKYGVADANARIEVFKVNGDRWYDMFVKYCKAEGLIGSELDSKLRIPVTRAEMVFAWSKLLQTSDMPKINTVNSLPDVTSSAPYYGAIIYFYEAGIIEGTDNIGTFKPGDSITRAEAAAIFMRLIDVSARNTGVNFGS
jgi:hypothetical protein